MAGKRKLFLTHAGELANTLVHAVGRDGLVAQFVRSYAARHSRPKLASDPDRVRELEKTIGRETLLVITVEMLESFPRVFATGRGGMLRPDEAVMCEAFSEEFVKSLRRALDWEPSEVSAEAEGFDRDLEMYEKWSKRLVRATGTATAGTVESPFPDRCAILLDPAMMEQARRAAAKFEIDAGVAAARILELLGRRGVRASAVKRKTVSKGRSRKRPTTSRPVRKAKGKSRKPTRRKPAARNVRPRRSPRRRPHP